MECPICFIPIDIDVYDDHTIMCLMEQEELIAKLNIKKDADDKMKVVFTKTQQDAIDFSLKKSKIICKNVYLQVLAKFQFSGFTEDDLKRAIIFIKDRVPITINFNSMLLQQFCKDAHYKNIFELGDTIKGSGYRISRYDWENSLFKGIYNTAPAIEKVKYGAVNITLDPHGVNAVSGYGDAYFELKPEVKLRTSMIHGDSGKKDLHLATFENNLSILNLLDEDLLQKILDIMNDKIPHAPSNYGFYIEAQIHGDILFNRDIAKLVLKKDKRKDDTIRKFAETFSKKNNVPIVWI